MWFVQDVASRFIAGTVGLVFELIGILYEF
jgi:hypothetical protein